MCSRHEVVISDEVVVSYVNVQENEKKKKENDKRVKKCCCFVNR